jgi:hypothetical protein
MYEIQGLSGKCTRHLIATTDIRNAFKMLQLADLFGVQLLKHAAFKAISKSILTPTFAGSVREQLGSEFMDEFVCWLANTTGGGSRG